ncbi:hypothetical protein NUU61_001880 [Penicillium alfredii]|uniref:Uncharacterized protein n=1 Tax=Penicillium alfredii TaxID=1506179 RepID=A0A9W9KGB2_9EURO|nr:uncharacterized protein NUU61_001880 [Penicillium alfredii]KAJ5104533.1 hypothetical protein NUU61_001880 [Penicillium alfredii]
MKSIFSLVALFGIALAQNAHIGLPTTGQKLSRGDDVTVQVQRPNTLSPSQEMAVAIGIASCGKKGCNVASDVLGTVVYNGKFKPEYHESGLPPYQNFTVKVPDSLAQGRAQVNVAHATLVGAGPQPYLESLNRTVVIV